MSTNSAVIKLFARPLDNAFRPEIGSIAHSLDDPALGGAVAFLVHEQTDRFRHELGQRLVARGGVDPESTKEGLGKAQGDVFVGRLHSSKGIAEICEIADLRFSIVPHYSDIHGQKYLSGALPER